MTIVYVSGGQGRITDKRVCRFDWVSDAWVFARHMAVNFHAKVVIVSAGAYTFNDDGTPRTASEMEMRNAGVGIMMRLGIMGVYWWSDPDVIERAIIDATDYKGQRFIDQTRDARRMAFWSRDRRNGTSACSSAETDCRVLSSEDKRFGRSV
jgi:hypothetical protein